MRLDPDPPRHSDRGFTRWHRQGELNRTGVNPAAGGFYDSLASLRSEGHPLNQQNRRHRGAGKFSDEPPKNGAPLPVLVGESFIRRKKSWVTGLQINAEEL